MHDVHHSNVPQDLFSMTSVGASSKLYIQLCSPFLKSERVARPEFGKSSLISGVFPLEFSSIFGLQSLTSNLSSSISNVPILKSWVFFTGSRWPLRDSCDSWECEFVLDSISCKWDHRFTRKHAGLCWSFSFPGRSSSSSPRSRLAKIE